MPENQVFGRAGGDKKGKNNECNMLYGSGETSGESQSQDIL